MSVEGFLEGTATDHRGRSFDDVLAFPDAELEAVHDYIQWLFPLPEASAFNAFAPVLGPDDVATLRRSAAARRNLERAAERMLRFYRATDHWLVVSDHNHLRITRILRCLALLVDRSRAEAFRNAIETRVAAAGNPVNPQSRDHWRRAAESSRADV